jgi:O-antigen biosynthesis protein
LVYQKQARFIGVDVRPVEPAERWPIHNGLRCAFDVFLIARRYIFESVIRYIKDRCPNTPIIYDTVDLHFLRESRDYLSRNSSAIFDADSILTWLETNATSEISHNRDQELLFVDMSDVTIVVSDIEFKLLKHYKPGARIAIVSNVHTLHKHSMSTCSSRNGVMFVGNFNHHPNNQAVSWFVTHILPIIISLLTSNEKADFVFHIAGANNHQAVQHVLQSAPKHLLRYVEFHGEVKQAELEGLYSRVRVSVAPLISGAGVKGKVNQAMSFGVPVVACFCVFVAM